MRSFVKLFSFCVYVTFICASKQNKLVSFLRYLHLSTVLHYLRSVFLKSLIWSQNRPHVYWVLSLSQIKRTLAAVTSLNCWYNTEKECWIKMAELISDPSCLLTENKVHIKFTSATLLDYFIKPVHMVRLYIDAYTSFGNKKGEWRGIFICLLWVFLCVCRSFRPMLCEPVVCMFRLSL